MRINFYFISCIILSNIEISFQYEIAVGKGTKEQIKWHLDKRSMTYALKCMPLNNGLSSPQRRNTFLLQPSYDRLLNITPNPPTPSPLSHAPLSSLLSFASSAKTFRTVVILCPSYSILKHEINTKSNSQ